MKGEGEGEDEQNYDNTSRKCCGSFAHTLIDFIVYLFLKIDFIDIMH